MSDVDRFIDASTYSVSILSCLIIYDWSGFGGATQEQSDSQEPESDSVETRRVPEH
ncbi:uncharacterized protein BDW47DRAFT_113860 [Aspergillus candidus]|uniref:Uncharacterized protein n=1 Tax=Aspergillus candidus TaxID=41067 RepID=A0A2I2EYP5_ASPCN|nr:hypothetical protein BDW47DRAFT_113860 [Aspergillus candidus]PLB33498.1 hypothetical protein BDW47DRAFT_113860 [Aspergillus candidus]